MAYTVKQLAQLSGVSVRTLHWYDKTDLLPPAFCTDNGYRYYEEEQLLRLQQILFFRELDFSLKDILRILDSDRFDQLAALLTHKRTLQDNLTRTKKLIRTIDKTINHLKGNKTMKDQDYYAGFDLDKQNEYEQYLVNYQGTVAEDLIAKNIAESKKRTLEWGSQEWTDVKNEGNAIYAAIAKCIKNNQTPRSKNVQTLVHKHYKMTERFYDVSKDVYTGLAQLYCEHPDFAKFFDPHHPKLATFLAEAMRVYASKNLK